MFAIVFVFYSAEIGGGGGGNASEHIWFALAQLIKKAFLFLMDELWSWVCYAR